MRVISATRLAWVVDDGQKCRRSGKERVGQPSLRQTRNGVRGREWVPLIAINAELRIDNEVLAWFFPRPPIGSQLGSTPEKVLFY